MTTHSDHYNTNFGYSTAAYSKAGGIHGAARVYRWSRSTGTGYYWSTTGSGGSNIPMPTTPVRVAEELVVSSSTGTKNTGEHHQTIDYKIDSLWEENGVSKIRSETYRPDADADDPQLTFKDGTSEMYHVPLNLMFGAKPNENASQKRELMEEWKWTHPTYVVEIKRRLTDLKAKRRLILPGAWRMLTGKNNFIGTEW